MSEFPQIESFLTRFSESHINSLKNSLFDKSLPVVVKKEKNQYVYDLDGNKYADFYLNNGSVICGHNNPLLTAYIKNGISAGTSTCFLSKFYNSLVKQFKEIALFDCISFYNSIQTALISLFNTLKPQSTGVNTVFLLRLLNVIFPGMKIEKAEADKVYDLFIFEPLDFDGDLSEYDYSICRAELKCSFESRAAFRLNKSFIRNLKDIPIILSANNIANGMDAAVIISAMEIPGENIPSYKALAILETMKYFFRTRPFNYNTQSIHSPAVSFQNKSIFKLKRVFTPTELLKYGIIMKGDAGFISTLHTEHDIKRLERALAAYI